MQESLELRLKALARRAGFAGASPGAVLAAIALLLLAVAVGAWRWWPREAAGAVGAGVEAGAPARGAARSSGNVGGAPGDAAKSAETSAAGTIVIHVVGAVRQPGVYKLPADSRVEAAIQVAGGFTREAAPEALNLAGKVADGEQVAVPTRQEVASGGTAGGHPAGAGKAGSGGTGGRATGGAAGSAGGSAGAKVNINTADATQLDALPGVGPSTAAKIVADRQANGPFATPDELGRVPGIGPKKLEQLKVLISVR